MGQDSHKSRISSFVLQNKLSYNLTATPSRVFQETVEEVKRSIPSIRPARRWVLIQKRIAAKVQSSGSRSIFLDDRCQFISILPGFRSYQECPCDNSIIIITITLSTSNQLMQLEIELSSSSFSIIVLSKLGKKLEEWYLQ